MTDNETIKQTLKDIPGAGLVGSVVVVIGDIVLFAGDLVVATLAAMLTSIEYIGPAISTGGQFLREAGLVSAETGELVSVLGIGILLAWLVYRAGRAVALDVAGRIN